MKAESNNQRGFWGSRLGFILAASGSAIGLGNVWKFPYIAGENGGAAFLFIYLICILMIGLPILNVLSMLRDQVENQSMKEVIEEIRKNLEGGTTLSKCFEKYPKIFDNIMLI